MTLRYKNNVTLQKRRCVTKITLRYKNDVRCENVVALRNNVTLRKHIALQKQHYVAKTMLYYEEWKWRYVTKNENDVVLQKQKKHIAMCEINKLKNLF